MRVRASTCPLRRKQWRRVRCIGWCWNLRGYPMPPLSRLESEEVDGLHVDDLAGDENAPGGNELVQQQTILGGVVDAQVPAFGDIFHVAAGKALQAGYVAIVRGDDDRAGRRVED